MAYVRIAFSVLAGMVFSVFVFAAEQRRIEEIVVTAEKRESTVSDTSISITALNQDFLEDMGIQGADEMVNFVPAMTRNNYDLVIRGIGRNFRSLGGDPGVASYYNGVYSPDFGIAASENALYDLARVEVLRGPQGTLYGRNSIGGAVNYITNDPTYHVEGELRAIGGNFDTREYYGVLSGPIIDDTLAYRFVGVTRDRDGAQESIGPSGSKDRNSIDDQNFALTLLWDISEKMSLKVRGNDRRSLRKIGGANFFEQGPAGARTTTPDNSFEVFGFRDVTDLGGASFPGAVEFTHPVAGTRYGARRRPGVDRTLWPYIINPNFANPEVGLLDPGTPGDANPEVLTNGDNQEEFDHMAGSLDFTWELSDTTTLKYTFGYQNFIYYFDKDWDQSNSPLSDYGDTVTEDVDSWSHELQLFWQAGDRVTGTSGIYVFSEDRMQHYGIRNRADQGRTVLAQDQFGTFNVPFVGDVNVYTNLLNDTNPGGFIPPANHFADLAVGSDTFGPWTGDTGVRGSQQTDLKGGDTGAMYEHRNDIENDAYAAYTQIDVELSDRWSVTLGLRYAKDERYAFENRGGYDEIAIGNTGGGEFNNRFFPDGAGGSTVNCDPATGGDPEAGFCNTMPWLYEYVLWTDCCFGLTTPAGQFITPSALLGAFNPTGVNGATGNPTGSYDQALSGLGLWNLLTGAATLTGDPNDPTINPLTPVCPLTQQDCGGLPPLSLGGIPISWGSKVEGDDEWDAWNYRINFNYEPTDDILIYFGVTTGYRAGGYSLGEPDARDNPRDSRGFPIPGGGLELATYDQEDVLAFEIGYKGLHFDGTLSLNMAVYYYDYENYQDDIDFYDPVRQSIVNTVGNIPAIENLGFEIDGMWLASDHITIGGNYSYTQSEYDETFLLANNSDPRFPQSIFGGLIGGDPFDAPPAIFDTYVRDVDGEQIKGIPKHKGVIWSDVNWSTDWGTFDWYLVAAITGEYANHTFARPQYDIIPKRERYDTRLTWRSHSGTWQVSAFVDNILDETYVRSIGVGGEGNDWQTQGTPLYPRFYGMEVFWRFGQN